MPRREKFKQPIKCEKCEKMGEAEFDEFENPVFSGGNLDTRLLSVSVGFKIESGKIFCIPCKAPVSS